MTEGCTLYIKDERLDKIIQDIAFVMGNFKKYKESVVERNNNVDSVINEAKEVARKHFESSEYALMTAEKRRHERDKDQVAHLVSTLKKACESVFSVDDDGEVVNDHLKNALNRLKLRRYFSLSKELPAVDTRNGNEAGIVKLLFPLLPKVFVSAAKKRSNPTVQTVAAPFNQSTVQKELYTAYDKLRHEVNGRGTEAGIKGKVQNPLRFFQERVTTSFSSGGKALAKLAVRALVAPVSSVAAERGGSFLRKLSEPDRTVVSEEETEKDNREALRRAKAREKRKDAPTGKEPIKQIER